MKYLNDFKQNQLVPLILYFPDEKLFEDLFVCTYGSTEMSQDVKQWSKP